MRRPQLAGDCLVSCRAPEQRCLSLVSFYALFRDSKSLRVSAIKLCGALASHKSGCGHVAESQGSR